MNNKLKIAILLNSDKVQAWIYSVIEKLVTSDYAVINPVVYFNGPDNLSRPSGFSGSLISRAQRKLDRLLFSRADSYDAVKDISQLVKGINEIRVGTVKNNGYDEFTSEDIAKIKNYNPDIILKFTDGNLSGPILQLAKYGLWGFSMNHRTGNTEIGSGYYEVVSGNPVTSGSLLILKDHGERDITISRNWESTCSHSVHLNRNKLYWRASLVIPRIIHGIHTYGTPYFEELTKKYSENDGFSEDRGDYEKIKIRSAKPFTTIKLLIRKSLKKIFYTDPFSWILLFNPSNNKGFPDNSYAGYRRLQPSNDRFWADPFVVSSGDRHFVFVEEFIYRKNRGHISVLELDRQGEIIKSLPVIEHPYHMSYPHVFQFKGSYYMIPETCENHTIDLYKSTDFPYKWTFVRHIMSNIEAMDSTLFHYRDKWWLFTLVEKISFASDNSPELYIYFNDDFMSDNWVSHPLNPVVSDVRTARPAGNIFTVGGAIYRPSQDCSERYGQALNINQILVLTETNYAEKEVIKVNPDWDNKLKGIHTLNFSDSFSIADAYYFRRRLF